MMDVDTRQATNALRQLAVDAIGLRVPCPVCLAAKGRPCTDDNKWIIATTHDRRDEAGLRPGERLYWKRYAVDGR